MPRADGHPCLSAFTVSLLNLIVHLQSHEVVGARIAFERLFRRKTPAGHELE